LKKVKDNRDEKRIDARGGEDEVMRMIFVAEKKRWRASLDRAASKIPTIYEEEELQEPDWNQVPEYDEEEFDGLEVQPNGIDELDQLIDRDGEELDALMAQMDIGMMDIDPTDHDKRNESETWMEDCPTD